MPGADSNSPAAASEPTGLTLTRGLGPISAFSIVISSVLATGVVIQARAVVCETPTPAISLAVWVAAGLLSLAGALTYAELATMLPRAGGEYVFLREAYGPLWGFLYGWMRFFIANSGGQAALVVAFTLFLDASTGGGLDVPFFSAEVFGYSLRFGSLQAIALGVIALATLINCAPVSANGLLAVVIASTKLALVVSLTGYVLLFASGDWSHLTGANNGGRCEGIGDAGGAVYGFGLATLGALWAYNGWYGLTLVAGEVRNPRRSIPLALIGGMATIVVLYVVVNLTYFYVLTPAEIANVPPDSAVAMEASRKLFGDAGRRVIAALLAASSFGALHAGILANARLPYAMARDRLFFSSYARLSPRSRVPVKALLMQAQWTSVLALASSLTALTEYVMFGAWIFFGLGAASVFVLRRKMPNAERPFRTWGYPFVPALFVLGTALLLANSLITRPRQSLVSLGLLALGLPAYWYWKRTHRVESAADHDGSAPTISPR
jgi:basic amino acid/polyamine antiporter, APA family